MGHKGDVLIVCGTQMSIGIQNSAKSLRTVWAWIVRLDYVNVTMHTIL